MTTELEQANEKLQMASYAKQVLDNPAYKQAMMVIRADLLSKFTKISFKEVEELLEIKRRMDTVENLQGLFERTMKEGKIAEHQIKQLNRK